MIARIRHHLALRTSARFFDAAACALAALILVAAASPATAAPRTLTTGFYDEVFGSPDAATLSTWLDRAAAVDGQIVRIGVSWNSVAPERAGAGFNAASAGDPAYRWSALDESVRQAAARGLQIVVTAGGAPTWAEGSRRPPNTAAGTWRPDPNAYGDFAHALAERYSGRFPDPLAPGATLPSVRNYQAWNEPNLSAYLAPQWDRRGGQFVAASPARYRSLLNAFYAGVKAVDKRNVVVTAGTAPFGDPNPGQPRISPVAFLRGVLSRPAHFDVLAHHPYAIAGPSHHALSKNDVTIPDLGKLNRLLSQARRARTALPAGKKRLWVTEMGWDSRPPDPQGVPAPRQARWLEQAFYILWKQGVDTITWFQLRDSAPVPDFPSTNQSGIYLHDGRPKPSATAFRFPFVVDKVGRRLRAWGRTPVPGRVRIEARTSHGWATVAQIRAGSPSRPFLKTLKSRARAFRAICADRSGTLTWYLN